mgnify:CR=1 FL=1
MKHYFKFAFREMLKNKLIALGSLASMVVGILSACLIYVWIDNETSTDKFHENIDNIYLTLSQQSPIDNPEPINAKLFFKVDYKEYPQIKGRVSTSLYSEDRIKLKKGDVEFRGRGLISDSTFFDFFDFKLLEGDRENVLKDPKSLVLSETMAAKIFGDDDPIGETLYLECDQKGFYQVAAIMNDIPSNSSIHFDFIVPAHSQQWWSRSSEEFLLVDENFDQAAFNESFKHVGRSHEQFKESILSTVAFKDVYFDKHISGDLFVKFGNREEVNTLLLVALVVLLVSVFNFTNLQTTLAYSQLKTRGIKQVNGATKADFLVEVLISRFVYSVFCIGLTFLLFELVKPTYLDFLEISQNFSTLEFFFTLIIGVVSFVIISALLTVLQTSRVLTSQALMGSLSATKGGNAGKVLTTVQYVFAITLIIVTAVVFKQFSYMQNKELGFEPENVVSVKFFDDLPYDFENPEAYKTSLAAQKSDYALVKSELLNIPGVQSYSQGPLPTDGSGYPMSWKLSNSDFEYSEVNMMSLEPAYAEMLGLDIVEGRFFSDSLDRSRQHKVIINEAARDYWNMESIDGAKVASSSWDGEDDPWQVIGVVKNFHYEHLSKKVKPLIMTYFNDVDKEFLIRLNSESFKSSLEAVEELFTQVNPKRVFDYTVLESKVQAQYDREKKLSQIFILFTLTGLIISSIGLFTFALYETRKRIKEIGIRKVVGASVQQVVGLLSLSFVKWVLLAFLIACPVGWYFMSSWLDNFANQTSLDWWVFVGAGILTLVLALLTVVGQTYVAAKRNPVESLRYE